MQHNIILPDLGQTTAEAKIVQLLKSRGDTVKRGEPVLLVSTDKAEVEVESFEDGFLREWLVEEGALAPALAPLAVLTNTPDEAYEIPGAPIPDHQTASPRIMLEPATREKIETLAAPAARRAAKQLGIDLRGIDGTGVQGMITTADVQKAAESKSSGKPHVNAARDRFSAMAAATTSSKREIPHFYVSRDVSLTHSAQWRKRWNESPSNLHVTWNDIFVRCAAQALNQDGALNMNYYRAAYERRRVADILMVAAGEPGLTLVPVPNPSALSWKDFLALMRASNGSSYPAGFWPPLAISNLGMFGVKQFAAIIPPGCTAILAIGAVREEAIVKNGEMVVEPVCTLTLSADHRLVDGIAAARFLEHIQQSLDAL